MPYSLQSGCDPLGLLDRSTHRTNMASSFLYHITPSENVDSILKSGLEPRAGKWFGPQRYRSLEDLAMAFPLKSGKSYATKKQIDPDARRIAHSMKRMILSVTDEDGFLKVQFKGRVSELQRHAKLGYSFFPHVAASDWPPHIFLSTSLMAAYEVAHDFSLDQHHSGKPLIILTIHRSMIPGQLVPDAYLHIGSEHRALRIRRRRLGSLMTDAAIPAQAVAPHREVPNDLLKLAEFRRWLGIETYKKRRK